LTNSPFLFTMQCWDRAIGLITLLISQEVENPGIIGNLWSNDAIY